MSASAAVITFCLGVWMYSSAPQSCNARPAMHEKHCSRSATESLHPHPQHEMHETRSYSSDIMYHVSVIQALLSIKTCLQRRCYGTHRKGQRQWISPYV